MAFMVVPSQGCESSVSMQSHLFSIRPLPDLGNRDASTTVFSRRSIMAVRLDSIARLHPKRERGILVVKLAVHNKPTNKNCRLIQLTCIHQIRTG